MCTMIVDCSGFVLEHSVIVQEDGVRGFKKIAQLPTDELAGFAINQNVNKIFLNGNTEYCFGIKENIEKQLITEYSNNNIEIEVIR